MQRKLLRLPLRRGVPGTQETHKTMSHRQGRSRASRAIVLPTGFLQGAPLTRAVLESLEAAVVQRWVTDLGAC